MKPLSSFGIQDALVNEGNGLYEVAHDDAVIGTHMNATQQSNLKQTEYRYAGSNPNNYVTFNNELWRIIGLVNTPEGSRVKLIRNESIGSYSWDSSESSINGGYGVNEWSQADIMKLLNPGYDSESVGGSLYFNKSSGNCYRNYNNANNSCNFTNNGMNEESKSKIDSITWNTGNNGTNDYTSASNGLSKIFYNYEKSNNNGKICTSGNSCSDTVARTTTWQGFVGLMSPSDYGYATSGGTTTNRESCMNKELYGWNNSAVSDCKNNDWLYNSTYQWTLNPIAFTTLATSVLRVYTTGRVNGYGASDAVGVRLSVYLTSNTRVSGGEGSQSNPYTLK